MIDHDQIEAMRAAVRDEISKAQANAVAANKPLADAQRAIYRHVKLSAIPFGVTIAAAALNMALPNREAALLSFGLVSVVIAAWFARLFNLTEHLAAEAATSQTEIRCVDELSMNMTHCIMNDARLAYPLALCVSIDIGNGCKVDGLTVDAPFAQVVATSGGKQ